MGGAASAANSDGRQQDDERRLTRAEAAELAGDRWDASKWPSGAESITVADLRAIGAAQEAGAEELALSAARRKLREAEAERVKALERQRVELVGTSEEKERALAEAGRASACRGARAKAARATWARRARVEIVPYAAGVRRGQGRDPEW